MKPRAYSFKAVTYLPWSLSVESLPASSVLAPHPSDASSFATSPTLVGQVQAREQEAWRRFVDLYGPLIFAWGRRGGLTDEDAADVLQEVLSSVSRAIGGFDPAAPGRLRGWLWTITRNKIRDHHRKLAEQVVARGGDTALYTLNGLPEQWNDDESDVTRLEVRALYHRALELIRNDFQPQTWRAFWLAVVEERSTDEIATELLNRATRVPQAKSRVLRRLRAELGPLP